MGHFNHSDSSTIKKDTTPCSINSQLQTNLPHLFSIDSPQKQQNQQISSPQSVHPPRHCIRSFGEIFAMIAVNLTRSPSDYVPPGGFCLASVAIGGVRKTVRYLRNGSKQSGSRSGRHRNDVEDSVSREISSLSVSPPPLFSPALKSHFCGDPPIAPMGP